MAKHAIALGYFFLAVFCFVAFVENSIHREELLLGALLAALTGCGYVLSACSAQLKGGLTWLIKEAPQSPDSES